MVTHTAKDDSQGTLLNYILGYFEENNIKRKVRFINRLDRDTSGIVLACKNPFAQDKISSEFRDKVEKKYLAICQGIFHDKEGIVDAPIDFAASITPESTSFSDDSTIRAINGAAEITRGTIVAVET